MSEDRQPYRMPNQRENPMSAAEYRALVDKGSKSLSPAQPKGDPEHELQCEIVADFREAYPDYARLLFAIPNGGKLPYHKDKKGKVTSPQRIKLVREGLMPGVPDLFLSMPRGDWHGMYVEVKILPNKPSPDQVHMMHAFTVAGYYCQVVYDAEQAAELFYNYLTLPTP